MKRLGSSDSLGALISMCPSTEEHSPRSNHMYSKEYMSMLDGLDEEGCVEESGHVPEKKRRLSVDQVKALEKNFEVENKLEPERKVKLAQELGLQPRQVAVWFQNRRARWKTKQLERDYGVLKASFDSLKQNYESLKLDKDSLIKEIKELKSKLYEDKTESDLCIKEEPLMSESDINNHNNNKGIEPITPPASLNGAASDDEKLMKGKNDGPSESDSSDIFNEDTNSSPNASNSQQILLMSSDSSAFRFNCSSSPPPPSTNCFSFSDCRSECLNNNNCSVYHPEFVKIEEHNFFSAEDACNFFSDEAAPTLHWYSQDQWT